MTQEQRVINMLVAHGEVSNFWAFQNYILRLGAIIYELKKKGWEFNGQYGKERGLEKGLWKNYYYIVTKKP